MCTGELTYPEVGATGSDLPAGYHHVRRTRTLGTGEALFERAAADLMSWTLHRRAGVHVHTASARAEAGERVRLRVGRGPLHVDAPCEVTLAPRT